MFHEHFRRVLTLTLSLTVTAGLVFCASVSGGSKCLVLHSVVVEGQNLDSPRASGRDRGEYMMSQDFCLSEKYGSAELTGRVGIGSHDTIGWYGSTTIGMLPNPERIPPRESCEAIWSIRIYGAAPDNPDAYQIHGVVYVFDFKADRSIAGGRERSFDLSIELDKECLIPVGPMGEFENVSLAAKLSIDDSK